MFNFDMAILQSHEFIVGAVVAAILFSAFFASSLFRNIALALAAGGVVVLYVQGGIPNLIALSRVVQTELQAIPDFSKGLLAGVAVVAVLMVSFRPRTSS